MIADNYQNKEKIISRMNFVIVKYLSTQYTRGHKVKSE